MNTAFDFYNTFDPARWGRPEMPEARRVTEEWLHRVQMPPLAAVLELGCGTGSLSTITPSYVGLDLSLTALANAPPFRKVCSDMEVLPIRSHSIHFLFSWAALEHVPRPERVLAEIERITAPGGIALLAPAWRCRTWAAEGLEFRPYRDLNWTGKIRKASLIVRNSVPWRAMFEFPRRIAREIRARDGRPMPFDYKRLSPNLTAYVGTDCDAFTSMDPHAAILFFASRRWEILSHPGRAGRFLARAQPVVVRKPDII